MKYKIKLSCGHAETISIYGTQKEREQKIYWYEKYGKCEKCQAKDEGLPPLTGTENQIAWAMKIRNKTMNDIKIIDSMIFSTEAIKEYNKFVNWLKKNTAAKFWIDIEKYRPLELFGYYKEGTKNEIR